MTRINAGALYFAVLVAVLVAMFTVFILGLALFYTRAGIENNLYERLEYRAESGITYLLSNRSDTVPGRIVPIDLFGDGQDTVWCSQKDWGLYRVGIVYAVHATDTSKRVFLYGAMPDSTTGAALYLVDQGRPVLFAGKTLVKGTCYLPEAGVKAANINGNYFTEKKLVDGEIKKSGKDLPAVDPKRIESILKMARAAGRSSAEEVVTYLPNSTYSVPFEGKTLVLYSHYPLIVRRKNLSGNIMIISDSIVSIEEDTYLEDVIIFAPRVELNAGMKGNAHVFATDTLLVEKNITMEYPSTLALLEVDSVENKALLKIGEGCLIKGTVVLYAASLAKPQCSLVLSEKSVVVGEVYANGYTQMNGTVYGSMACNKLLVKTDFATYENHLLNAVIDRSKRSDYQVGSLLYAARKQQKNIKWLQYNPN